MTNHSKMLLRLQFLLRVIRKEGEHLALTDARLFSEPFTIARAERLATQPDLAERVEAFVSRFSRLQDTLGDKLLPVLLSALGEKPGAAIDNLDRAERLGYIQSVDDWLAMRNLRNQMVDEYRRSMTSNVRVHRPFFKRQIPKNECFYRMCSLDDAAGGGVADSSTASQQDP